MYAAVFFAISSDMRSFPAHSLSAGTGWACAAGAASSFRVMRGYTAASSTISSSAAAAGIAALFNFSLPPDFAIPRLRAVEICAESCCALPHYK